MSDSKKSLANLSPLIDYREQANVPFNIDTISRADDPSSMTTIELFQAHMKAHKLHADLNRWHGNDCDNLSMKSLSSVLPSPVGKRPDGLSIDAKDLTESQVETRHLLETLKSDAFRDHEPSPARITLIQTALKKIETLSSKPKSAVKLASCFDVLDTLLDGLERAPPESRKEEVQMIAECLFETLVHRMYVDDCDNYVEFQRLHWFTYLISIIRLMSASEFTLYLKKFSNLPDLSVFLKDYLFIIKKLMSRPDEMNPATKPIDPIYPECWIEMNLLACSTILKSLIYLNQILRSSYSSNMTMWRSYIECLLQYMLQDTLKPDRVLVEHRQMLRMNDLRKTSADYIWITWNSLNTNQKYELLDEVCGPLLRICITLNSKQRSVLLPIFYDMMHCDYTSQYVSPQGTICNSGSVCSDTTIGNQVNYLYEAEIERQLLQASRNGTSTPSECEQEREQVVETSGDQQQQMPQISSDESLPYLSFRDQPAEHHQHASHGRTSASVDGTVLTKFTHLIVGKLYELMIDMDFGDAEFKAELCAAISGDLKPASIDHQRRESQSNYFLDFLAADESQLKCIAKHTSNLISEFIQICLDSHHANRLSYNHLHLLCLFKLILFFRDKVDRLELYLDNLHKLWRLHHNAGRFTEAGFTLLEHAKSLPWSNKPLEVHYRIITRLLTADQPLSDYTNLKLHLYTTIIEYFDKGQLWEAAVPLCRELIDIYQFKLFDYPKLAQILAKLSTFFSNISSGHLRSQPEYFRVTFYGVGFPDCLRNSTMVYRGKPYEKLGDFQATLLSKYSDAELLRTLGQPDESLTNEPGAKYLQINACTPIVELKSKFKFASSSSSVVDVSELHHSILTYYKHNECDKFEFSRRLGTGGGGDDFSNMWRQRTTLTTNSLPGMLPFFCVFLQETNIISPIECAIEDLERANDRLSSMVNRFKADKRQAEDVRPLGQLLLGVVDAAVNGGITKYEQAFIDGRAETTSGATMGPSSSQSKLAKTATTPARSGPLQAQGPLSSSSSPLTATFAAAQVAQNECRTLPREQGSGRHHLTPQPRALPGADKCHELDQGGGATCDVATSTGPVRDRPCASGNASQVERLKRLMASQVPLLDEAIRLHSERVADVMRPQHEHLEASYKRLKNHIMSRYARYLPAHYNRISSLSYSSPKSIRSYRSLARSPNRSP